MVVVAVLTTDLVFSTAAGAPFTAAEVLSFFELSFTVEFVGSAADCCGLLVVVVDG